MAISRISLARGMAIGLLLVGLGLISADLQAQKTGRWAGIGAGVGALVGLVAGGNLGDVAAGAAVGAAGGAIAGSVSDSNDEKRAAAQRQAAQQQQIAEQQRALAEQQAATQQAVEQQAATQQAAEQQAGEAKSSQEQEVIAAIGEDNYRSYLALRDCQYDRSYALAGAGATATNPDHKLAAIWMEAIISVERRDTQRGDQGLQAVVAADPDIDTTQQASLEVDRVVLDLREERRQLGLPSCSG